MLEFKRKKNDIIWNIKYEFIVYIVFVLGDFVLVVDR